MRKKINEIVKQVLNVDSSELNKLEKFSDERWDSLAHINLIAAIEDCFDLIFDPEDMVEIKTIDDIENLVKRYK